MSQKLLSKIDLLHILVVVVLYNGSSYSILRCCSLPIYMYLFVPYTSPFIVFITSLVRLHVLTTRHLIYSKSPPNIHPILFLIGQCFLYLIFCGSFEYIDCNCFLFLMIFYPKNRIVNSRTIFSLT